VRVVHPRFGIILSGRGGALAKMLTPFRLGVGGRIGSGQQYMSWISLDDACGVIVHAIVLARVLSRPAIFPLPAFAARMVLGEMADDLLLASARVDPAKLRATRYSFRHSELEPTLRNLLGK
jgi:NAD dependent epimerase/dehydratase family enzyme